jgi:hypothetical protein
MKKNSIGRLIARRRLPSSLPAPVGVTAAASTRLPPLGPEVGVLLVRERHDLLEGRTGVDRPGRGRPERLQALDRARRGLLGALAVMVARERRQLLRLQLVDAEHDQLGTRLARELSRRVRHPRLVRLGVRGHDDALHDETLPDA